MLYEIIVQNIMTDAAEVWDIKLTKYVSDGNRVLKKVLQFDQYGQNNKWENYKKNEGGNKSYFRKIENR